MVLSIHPIYPFVHLSVRHLVPSQEEDIKTTNQTKPEDLIPELKGFTIQVGRQGGVAIPVLQSCSLSSTISICNENNLPPCSCFTYTNHLPWELVGLLAQRRGFLSFVISEPNLDQVSSEVPFYSSPMWVCSGGTPGAGTFGGSHCAN